MDARWPLEPDAQQMRAILDAATRFVVEHITTLPDQPAADVAGAQDLARALRGPAPLEGTSFEQVLPRLSEAFLKSLNTAGPGYLAFIPGGGLFAAAVADLLADSANRFVGLAFPSPALAQIEATAVRWLCDIFDYPADARGILTSGGSLANFSAILAARRRHLDEQFLDGTLYVTDQTHHSVQRAAILAGFPARNVRAVPTTPELHMDLGALRDMIRKDRESGSRPFLIVATAGTTNTGAVDPIAGARDIADEEGMWLHADGAYGGFFQMTARGRAAFAGIERADSITLDPHKGMFLPYGTGGLLVRDGTALRAAHAAGDVGYLQDLVSDEEIPSFSDYSPELSRDFRGLRVWLPVMLHGMRAFRDALDEKLDLAQLVYERLASEPGFEVPWRPELSTVAFRYRTRSGDDDAFNKSLLERINASKRIFLSSTVVGGRFLIRVSILSHRTHRDRIEEGLDIIVRAAREQDS